MGKLKTNMSIAFSDTGTNLGILQRARKRVKLNSSQFPTADIVGSANDWSDFVTGYAIGADARFQWDNTNHTKLPEGTTSLVINQSDYSFLIDEQGNQIVTLTGISVLVGTIYIPLVLIDRNDSDYDATTFGTITGRPTAYDKIADNIVRLDFKPAATLALGLKFFFQRMSPPFTAASTTTTTGFSQILDKGFWINAAYDAAAANGLPSLQGLAVEKAQEEKKVEMYFSRRNNDDPKPRMMIRRIQHI